MPRLFARSVLIAVKNSEDVKPQGEMADQNELGGIIKQQRLMKGLTARELSAKSGVSISYLGRMERGSRFPSGHILRKIARPLGFEESELLTLAGYLPQPFTERPSGQLDPYVAAVLSQEPVEIQRAVVSLLVVLKSLSR